MATLNPNPEQKFETTLAVFQRKAEALTITNAGECLEAKTVQRELRDEMKRIHLVLDGFVDDAKQALAKARDRLAKHIDPRLALDEALGAKVKDFERRERAAAEAEERRINEERRQENERLAEEQRKRDEEVAAAERKRREAEIRQSQKEGDLSKREAERMKKEVAEIERQAKEQAAKDAEAAKANVSDVRVAPNIPKVAGVPSRRNYYAEVMDANAILGQFIFDVMEEVNRQAKQPGVHVNIAKAIADAKSPLREYITINVQALNVEARRRKNPKEMEQAIPGIRCWEA